MALRNYNAVDGLLLINGTNITDWGETQPAMTIEDINPRSVLKNGLGGGAAKLKPVTKKKRLTVNLLPGSDQARFLVALDNADATIQASFTQVGSAEAEVLIDGTIMQRGPRGRIAEQSGSLSDEQFIIEFRDSTET